jgi:hypothetical protein
MAGNSPEKDNGVTRQEARMKQHGKGLGQVYQDAVEKRRKNSV